MGTEDRIERSIPVQSRVDMTSLARLDKYWMAEGYYIRTMSQLVSWSVDLICEVLEANKKMPSGISSAMEANRHLMQRGLYQPSMLKKGFKKRATALSFESLREEGVEPKDYVKAQYDTVHNKHSVKMLEGKVRSGKEEEGMHYRDDIEEALRKVEEEKEKERKGDLEVAVDSLKDRGLIAEESKSTEPTGGLKEGMSDEELNEYNRKREEDIRKRENADIDTTEMKFAKE